MRPLSEHNVDRVRPVMWIYKMTTAGTYIIASRVMRRNPDGSHSADITGLKPGQYLMETSEEPGKLQNLFYK